MKEPNYEKLIEFKRNGLTEQIHYGLIIHMNKSGIINEIGRDNNYKFYHRSCMKPLQASMLIDLGIDKKNNLTLDELAVCCASHTGEEEHQKRVLSILKKAGCNEEDLLLIPHQPLSSFEQTRLIKNNLPLRKIHHNCSGKHAAMLSICKHMGFSTKNYKDFSHPLSDLIINKVCELCETSTNDIIISKDGCGLPVVATTLEQLGKGYLNLFTNKKYDDIKNAFLTYPFLIGGKERSDSIIISQFSNCIAKVGACGLLVIVNIEKEECIIVKIADSNMESRELTAFNSLIQLKWPKKSNFSQINNIYTKKIISIDNENLGEIIPSFNLNH